MANMLFVSVDIEEEVKETIYKIVDEFKKGDFDCKYVEPENMHLTLRFFGEIGDKDVDAVKEGCRKAVHGFKQFKLRFEGVGAFPDFKHIKVLWVGCSGGAEQMKELASLLNVFVEVGQKDKREYSPHLTFGRIKSGKNVEKMAGLLKRFREEQFGESLIKEIVLKQSELTPKGPVYTELKKFELED